MNREIKFRAWYKNAMHYNISKMNDGLYWNKSGDFNIFAFLDPENKMMEYIGLKDKNVKEIYEGDIINTPSDKLLVVKWCNKYASFCLDKKGWIHNHWFGEAVEPENCEVVGNIYENQDLIS